MKISLALLLPLLLLSSGCSSWREVLPVEVKTVEVERRIPTQNRPSPVRLNDIHFYVVTEGNLGDFQKRFAKNPDAIYLHAETNAIRNSLNHMPPADLQQATLYINRQKHPPHDTKAWVDGLAKPCAGCERAIIEFGLKRVVYTTEITNEYEVLTAK